MNRNETETRESNENQHSWENAGLTGRQLRFIPILLATATYTRACEKGHVNRATLYEWLKDPAFRAEVGRRREEISQEAYGLLTQSLTRAVETLTGLLGS